MALLRRRESQGRMRVGGLQYSDGPECYACSLKDQEMVDLIGRERRL